MLNLLFYLDVEYLTTILPLCLMHGVLPPCSYIDKKESPPESLRRLLNVLYSMLPRQLFETAVFRRLMLSEDARETISLATFTHIFVHSSYKHLWNNLQAAMLFGYPVFCEFGALHLYSLFLAGGALASSPKGERLLETLTVGSTAQSVSTSASIAVQQSASNMELFKMDVRRGVSCGSSGAVYALMGCSFVLHCRNLYGTVNAMKKHLKTNKAPDLKGFSLIVFMADSFAGVVVIGSNVLVEYLIHRNSLISSTPSLMLSPTGFCIVDHAAHLQGFGCGVLFGAGSLLFARYFQSKKRKQLSKIQQKE